MQLSPKNIRERIFTSKMSGYAKIEVDTFVDEVARALEQANERTADLERELSEMEAQLQYLRSLENTLRDTMVNAQRSAEETISGAQKRAAEIVESAQTEAQAATAKAEEDVKNIISKAEYAKKLIFSYQESLREVMEKHLDIMEQEFSDVEQ